MNGVELQEPPADELPASPEETRHELLRLQSRVGPPIRAAFIQEHAGARAPGPLAAFVTERRLFALRMYLLLHCLALKDPWDATLAAGTWARALDATNKGAESTVSRSWSWLREKQLVRTETKDRMVRPFLLAEDASGAEYTRSRNYFKLPLAFFRDGVFAELDLPGTAVLLIALNKSRKGLWFELRKERESAWYGISPDTLQRGIEELQEHGLILIRQRTVKDARARYGAVRINTYTLLAPFAVTSQGPSTA
jgi:hypothetical protein